jgi:hypothetical protein
MGWGTAGLDLADVIFRYQKIDCQKFGHPCVYDLRAYKECYTSRHRSREWQFKVEGVYFLTGINNQENKRSG